MLRKFRQPKKSYIVQQVIVYCLILLGIQYHYNLIHQELEERSPLAADFTVPAPHPRIEVQAEEPALTPIATPTPTVAPAMPVTTDLWEQFKSEAVRIGAERGYPAKIIIAQAALESGRGTSYFARERANFMGLCAYDSDPNQACHFDSMAEQIHFYIDLMEKTPRYSKVWENRENPDIAIQEIKNAGYATDPLYVQKVRSMPEWIAP